MRNYFWLIIVMSFCTQQVFAQKDSIVFDVESHKSFLSKTIVPGVFILSSVLLTNSQLEKNWQIDIRNKVGNDFKTDVDDYIQYIPFAQIYIGDLAGLKSKNHWFDQSKNIAIGGAVTLIITNILKKGVGKERPDLRSNNSYSSGHTAASFMGATMLYYEFKDANMLYASSGFLPSTTVGALRVMNNRHWVSDVLAGAGIGILVGNLIYHIEPLKNWNPFKNSKNITFIPMMNTNEFTCVFSLQF